MNEFVEDMAFLFLGAPTLSSTRCLPGTAEEGFDWQRCEVSERDESLEKFDDILCSYLDEIPLAIVQGAQCSSFRDYEDNVLETSDSDTSIGARSVGNSLRPPRSPAMEPDPPSSEISSTPAWPSSYDDSQNNDGSFIIQVRNAWL